MIVLLISSLKLSCLQRFNVEMEIRYFFQQ